MTKERRTTQKSKVPQKSKQKKGRAPSNKSKESKIKKLIALSKSPKKHKKKLVLDQV